MQSQKLRETEKPFRPPPPGAVLGSGGAAVWRGGGSSPARPLRVCTETGKLNAMRFRPLLEVSTSHLGCRLETERGQRMVVRAGVSSVQTWKSRSVSAATVSRPTARGVSGNFLGIILNCWRQALWDKHLLQWEGATSLRLGSCRKLLGMLLWFLSLLLLF